MQWLLLTIASVTIIGNRHSEPSLNPDEAVCISRSTNNLGKSMNPTILPPATGKF